MSETAEKFERIKTPRAYHLVAEAIERRINSGDLRTGQALGTEADLVRQFGVNRLTVREALRLLEQAGLVRRDSSRRLTIGFRHTDGLTWRMTRVLMMHEVTFRELWETSLVVNIAAVEQAAFRATPEIVAELEANIVQAEAAAGKWAEVAELDRKWHDIVFKAAGNRVLQLVREPAAMLNLPATEMILERVKQAMPRMLFAHRIITESIERHHVENARTWMYRQMLDWRSGFEHAGKNLDHPVR
jgi:GntR family transcriptional regulator, transcriptional repressor for pyruvate dehydrogenase complex